MATIESLGMRTGEAALWRASDSGDASEWRCRLPDQALSLVNEIAGARDPKVPVTELALNQEQLALLAPALAPVLDALENGRGFVIVEGLGDHEDVEHGRARYWLIGQALARPVKQNVQGTLLYDVRDTGQDVSQGARFSVTNAESSFHTDNSFGDSVLDYVGLLCLRTALTGGKNQLVSGYTALDELRAEDPEAVEMLSRPFHVDRRGGIRPGEQPTTLKPVIAAEGGGVVYRYLRYWIEVGHQKAGEPLTAVQVRALDRLDEMLARPELAAEFALQPGEILLVNNRWILHNRTGFQDHPEPEKRRHYVRLWLEAR